MASNHNLYVSNYEGTVTYKLSYCGYSYTRSKVYKGKTGESSHYQSLLSGVPRTSNFVEGFHSKFNKALGVKRPPMWRFIFQINQFQTQTENSMSKIESPGGLPRLQRRKNREKRQRLLDTCKLYHSRFGTRKFITWITRITIRVPDFH